MRDIVANIIYRPNVRVHLLGIGRTPSTPRQLARAVMPRARTPQITEQHICVAQVDDSVTLMPHHKHWVCVGATLCPCPMQCFATNCRTHHFFQACGRNMRTPEGPWGRHMHYNRCVCVALPNGRQQRRGLPECNATRSFRMYVCQYVCMVVCLSDCFSLHVCVYVCRFVDLVVCVSGLMYVCIAICMSLCLSAYMYVCMYVCIDFCLCRCIGL